MRGKIAVLRVLAGVLCFCSGVLAGPQVLEVSPMYLEFTGYEGGPNPAAQVVSIWNSGHGPMDWTVTEDCNWVAVEPNSGTSSGEVDDVNVAVDITGLSTGTYNCQLTVDAGAGANSPQIVGVDLTIAYDPNLVGWWKFDDGSGSTAIDSSGLGNDGTLHNGPIWTTGQIDGALDFDGINDYVEVIDPADGSLDFGSGNFTISLWFKTTDTNGELVDKSGGNKGRQTGYSVYVGTYGTINDGEIGFRVSDGTSRDLIKTNNTYNDGDWHHLAAVRTGTGSANLNIYVDGVDVSTSSLLDEGAVGISNSYDLSIGAKYDAGHTNVWENFLDGVIDEVAIWDRALTGGEIRQIWEEGLGGRAYNPEPVDGASGVEPNVVLSWSPGTWAADFNGHDVYFGTDYTDVNEATTVSAEYMGNQDTNSWATANYDPCGLKDGTWYYWRIDEVNGPNTWKGDVWSF
ncbi:MAG: LamG domain-containing protein, partial [Planctomycetota bacterium]